MPEPELAAGHQLQARVDHAHGSGGLGGQPAVLVGGLVADLPRAVHLVAQAPHPDAVRFLGAVRDPQVRQRGAGREVAVFQQVQRLGDAAGAEVDGHHRLHPGLARSRRRTRPGRTRWSRCCARPGRAGEAAVARADAVLPAVAGDEVAAGVADRGDAQFAGELQYVAPEAVLVGGGVAGLVDAGVDAPAEVFDERAECAPTDGATLNAGSRVRDADSTKVSSYTACVYGLRRPSTRGRQARGSPGN